MLKRLKVKFIAIVMTLVGLVLVASLAISLYSSYSSQRNIIIGALERNLAGDIDSVPTIGAPQHDREGGGDRGRNMLALGVLVSSDGVILQTSDGGVYINQSVLKSVVSEVLSTSATSGDDAEAHVSWMSRTLADGSVRIAIVDTTDADSAMHELIVRDAQIAAIALLVLFGITYALAAWSLAPVAEAWESQRRFVADASHELKTPLAVILANTEILMKDEAIPAESRRWVESTASEASHMKSLVNDLLQLARADEGAAQIAPESQREDLDLSQIVDVSALEFDAVAFEHGCTIDASIEPDVHVKGDRAWIERLVRILIDNACKYAAPDSAIRLELAREGSKARYSVTNQGDPIDPDDLEHIFDRFYRSDKSRERSESTGGFGLGLAIAKSIAEAHGGTIKAASTKRDGTTFTVVI